MFYVGPFLVGACTGLFGYYDLIDRVQLLAQFVPGFTLPLSMAIGTLFGAGLTSLLLPRPGQTVRSAVEDTFMDAACVALVVSLSLLPALFLKLQTPDWFSLVLGTVTSLYVFK